jgi:hypothetical protein
MCAATGCHPRFSANRTLPEHVLCSHMPPLLHGRSCKSRTWRQRPSEAAALQQPATAVGALALRRRRPGRLHHSACDGSVTPRQ